MGRKKKENARNEVFHFRVNKEDTDLIEYLSCKTGKSKPDVIREALRMYENYAKYLQ